MTVMSDADSNKSTCALTEWQRQALEEISKLRTRLEDSPQWAWEAIVRAWDAPKWPT